MTPSRWGNGGSEMAEAKRSRWFNRSSLEIN